MLPPPSNCPFPLIHDVHCRVGHYYGWKEKHEQARISFGKYLHNRAHGVGGAREAEETMKLILAIIQPSKLEAVKEALNKVEVFRLTIVDVQGFGRQKGQSEMYRGHELTVQLLRKVQLQIAVNEDFVEPTVNAIMEAGRTGPEGRIGDGKIFILPLEDCIRIRTGERGPEAI